MTTNSILNDFCALCRKYGLPCDPGDVDRFNWTLFNIFKEKRTGSPWTALENIGDPSSVADIARLLAQVMDAEETNGDIKVEGVRPVLCPNPETLRSFGSNTSQYSNPETLWLLKGSLVGLLKQRVKRYGNKLVLRLSDISAKIVSDNANGPENGFTFDELRSIIQAVEGRTDTQNNDQKEGLKEIAKKLQGRKAKDSDSFTHTKDISPLAKDLENIVSEYGLNTMARYSFVADFLFEAGFLDFKSDEWKEDYIHVWKDKYKEKYDFIKAFIDY